MSFPGDFQVCSYGFLLPKMWSVYLRRRLLFPKPQPSALDMLPQVPCGECLMGGFSLGFWPQNLCFKVTVPW